MGLIVLIERPKAGIQGIHFYIHQYRILCITPNGISWQGNNFYVKWKCTNWRPTHSHSHHKAYYINENTVKSIVFKIQKSYAPKIKSLLAYRDLLFISKNLLWQTHCVAWWLLLLAVVVMLIGKHFQDKSFASQSSVPR